VPRRESKRLDREGVADDPAPTGTPDA